eukprot:TRINITY_DN6664_c0_g3_i4.p2 TRINITY_DN6664_c0_g3~~TRINITY_DN6664_c0_g3_i4.p2  ORF type:complete len:179 (+),score=28.67 TRINITY_DN6664_c0_g3_i4:649-1185(+)
MFILIFFAAIIIPFHLTDRVASDIDSMTALRAFGLLTFAFVLLCALFAKKLWWLLTGKGNSAMIITTPHADQQMQHIVFPVKERHHSHRQSSRHKSSSSPSHNKNVNIELYPPNDHIMHRSPNVRRRSADVHCQSPESVTYRIQPNANPITSSAVSGQGFVDFIPTVSYSKKQARMGF